MHKNALSIGLTVLLPLALAGCTQEPAVSFKNDVKPILDRYCSECHAGDGAGIEASGFKTESYATLMQGTKFGPVVVASDATSSSLYRLVAGKVDKSIQMPHGKASLSEAEITVIEGWIDQGAKDN